MHVVKQWVSGTAYRQTCQRLDFIVDFIEMNGFSGAMEKKMEQELGNLEKLVYGSQERLERHQLYQQKTKMAIERRQKEKDSQ